MANETHGFVRVPPDSTGKRITHSVLTEITVGNVVDQSLFLVGESVTFGTTPYVGQLSEVTWLSPSSADLHISLYDPIPNGSTLVVGENILINEVVAGTVSDAGNLFYIPQTVLAGGRNNVNILEVNHSGAALTAFVNGSPEFDAFGKLQVSHPTTLANYVHTYDTLPDLFTTEIVGSGVVAHEPNVSGVVCQIGTDAGAKVVRTSDTYHVYQPGVSQILTFTGALGDTGKANVVRRAGLYDAENGMFFEMYESTFNVVLRSKSTGVVVDTKIPSSQWNHDRMDGQGGAFNPSGVALNPSMNNIFWIDYQWLGAGSIRFGVYVNGQRMLLHTIHHTNSLSRSYMTTASLPFRYEIENLGVSASTSEFRIFCATVKTEGAFEPRRTLSTTTASLSITSQTSVPVLSIRPKETFNGIPNRGTLYMYAMMMYNAGSDPMLVQLNRGVTTTGGTWADVGTWSIAQVNLTPTTMSAEASQWSIIVPPGQTVQVKVEAFSELRQGFRRKANITIPIEQVMSAKLLSGNTGGLLHVVVSWDEVRN